MIEKESDEKKGGKPSQGDHLLVQKAKAQRTVSHAKFTSPTTPVKPLSANSNARHPLRSYGDISIPPPVILIIVIFKCERNIGICRLIYAAVFCFVICVKWNREKVEL